MEFNRVAPLVIVEAHRRAFAPIELGLCYETVDDHKAAQQLEADLQ